MGFMGQKIGMSRSNYHQFGGGKDSTEFLLEKLNGSDCAAHSCKKDRKSYRKWQWELGYYLPKQLENYELLWFECYEDYENEESFEDYDVPEEFCISSDNEDTTPIWIMYSDDIYVAQEYHDWWYPSLCYDNFDPKDPINEMDPNGAYPEAFDPELNRIVCYEGREIPVYKLPEFKTLAVKTVIEPIETIRIGRIEYDLA